MTLTVVAGLGLQVITVSGTTAHLPARQDSPAEGRAQVIAQGVATMPRVEVGWRVVGMEARPRDAAPVAGRSLGFVLAEDDAVLVEDQTTGTRTLLNPGEAHQGARQRRSSLDDDPAEYIALELVVAADLENQATIGDGDLLFAGDPFAAPAAR